MSELHYTLGKAAELLAEPGMTSTQAANRLRYLVKQGMLHHFGARDEKGGKTAAWLYPEREICKAAIIFALIDAGVEDQTVTGGVAAALTGHHIPLWLNDDAAAIERILASPIPMINAIAAVRAGQWPSFVLTTFKAVDGGAVYRFGELLMEGQTPSPPSDPERFPYVPRVSLVIELRPLFLRLLRDRSAEV